MIPSKNWFPTTLQDRAAWYENFVIQFDNISVDLGITPAEITTVTNDSVVMEALADAQVLLENYMTAVRNYRKYITEGAVGDALPDWPTAPVISMTGTPTGIFERIDLIVKRIRASVNYTPEIGGLLGIIPQSPSRPLPGEMQPMLKVGAVPGSKVEVSFARKFTDGIVVETKIDNAATWSEVGKFYSSPAELVIPENPQNLPRSVQVRARYVEGNEAIGLYSDAATVSTQPAA